MSNEVKEQIEKLMTEENLKQTEVCRAMGVGVSAFNQWLKDKYIGDCGKIEENVKSFIKRFCEKKQIKRKDFEFCKTSIAKKVFEVAKICHLDCEIGVVCGKAGLGKTFAIKEYTKQNRDVILIEADLGYTAKYLFQDLHKRLGFDGVGSVHKMFDDVVMRLKDSERLIIVDEAENLPYRALELLRRVYDKAGIGVMLVGMPRLISNLRGKRGEYAQLYSRVGIFAQLEDLKAEDAQMIVNSVLPREANQLYKDYLEACYGNTRVLSKLLMRSVRIAEINERPIDREIIKSTAEMLII